MCCRQDRNGPGGTLGVLDTEAGGGSEEAQEGCYLCSGEGAKESGSRSTTQRPAWPGAHLSYGCRNHI